MNKAMPFVWESSQYLRELISKEQNKRKALRLQMLYLLATRQATTRSKAATLLGLDRDTIGDWLNKYERGGLASLLEISIPCGLHSSLPENVVEAMRLKLQEPAGLASFKALHSWVEQNFQPHSSYRVIHYTATKVLGGRLAVGRRSHIKKKRAMRRPFVPAFKHACNWLSSTTSQFIGKLRYSLLKRKSPLIRQKRIACRYMCGRWMKADWG